MYILYQVFCCWLIFGTSPTEKIIVDNKEPEFQIEHLNEGKKNLFDRYFSIVQGKAGRFITTRYRISSNYYTFFYDLKEKRQFNTLINSVEGIFDDVYGSGYHPDLRFSNLDNVMYSSAKHKGITTIYLFRIKI